ncbi:MAG TPA: glycerophosphoryl diester phosphodiesterase membrane domain-containing protein [Gaiellaceae bacterium]|nr:glycerophosphoryl diester phosphodiesterase membrane domain-containing protein [Gaiellaceae bacterium]
MRIFDVLGEAFAVYRRLFRRSVVVAGLIFAVVALAQALAAMSGTALALLVSLVLSLVGGLLVQGALVEVVRDLHEGREPATVNTYYDRTRGRLGTLVGSSLIYGLGVVVGLILFVVPGLIAIARWSLIVPLVMIEGRGRREAFRRSAELVRGQTGRILLLVVAANIVTAVVSVTVGSALGFIPGFLGTWVGGAVAGALAVPYQAHVLTVLYYRLTEPAVPILPEPGQERWSSIWDEERTEGPE